MDNNKKEAPILAICPICGKRFRDEGNHITLQLLLPTSPDKPQQVTYPLFLCTTCGIFFHPFAVLDELKKRLRGEGSPPANVKVK